MAAQSNTELVESFGIDGSTLLIQGVIIVLWLGMVVWAILKVLKKTKGTESAAWVIFITLVPFIGIPVSLLHFRKKEVLTSRI